MTPTVVLCPIETRQGLTRREAERRAVATALDRLTGIVGTVLSHTPSGAPFLPGRPDLTVSISHSLTVAAVIAATRPVGIDVEQPRQQLARVAGRFLSPREQAVAATLENGLLRAWTAKEAVYKAALTPGLDFARDIVLDDTFSSARCKGSTPFALTTIENLPDNNLLTIATPGSPIDPAVVLIDPEASRQTTEPQ